MNSNDKRDVCREMPQIILKSEKAGTIDVSVWRSWVPWMQAKSTLPSDCSQYASILLKVVFISARWMQILSLFRDASHIWNAQTYSPMIKKVRFAETRWIVGPFWNLQKNRPRPPKNVRSGNLYFSQTQ